jgi:hypothetical protein
VVNGSAGLGFVVAIGGVPAAMTLAGIGWGIVTLRRGI